MIDKDELERTLDFNKYGYSKKEKLYIAIIVLSIITKIAFWAVVLYLAWVFVMG